MSGQPRGAVWGGRLVLAAGLAWAFGIACYYFSQQVFWVPGSEGEGQKLAGLFGVFEQLLEAPKRLRFGDKPFPLSPFFGAMFFLALLFALGRMFLRWFAIYMPPGASQALAVLCGISIAGIALEPLGIFGWLYGPVVWGMFALMIAIAWRAAYARQSRVPVGVGLGDDARVYRRALREEAQNRYRDSLQRPAGLMGRGFAALAWMTIAAITALSFYYALLYPETYWDSLILYMGYARMTFLEHAFPVKVVGQVGIGLGANYPHLFALLGASAASMFGHWSTVYQQLLAPVAGLAATALVYHTALRLTRRINWALACALIFRAIPYGIHYSTRSSDYALVLLFSAGFCYLALLYIETGLWGYLAALTLVVAGGCHLNYLMLVFWGLWALVVAMAHARFAPRDEPGRVLSDAKMDARFDPDFTEAQPRMALGAFLRSGRFWAIASIGIALSLPWYVRNWIVCGNPLYAFFPEILGGVRINPEVMASAMAEWRANGDGIGQAAQALYGENTLWNKLRATWPYFVTQQSQVENFWKLAPVFVAFCVPGVLFWMGRFVVSRGADKMASFSAPQRFGAVLGALVIGHLAYFYLLGDFYLYQILAILPAVGIFAAYWPLGMAGRTARGMFGLLVIAVGLVPGVAVSLIGAHPLARRGNELHGLYQPLREDWEIYRQVYPRGEIDVLRHVNATLRGERILTHENRHLLLDPSITLVHLDDWEIQPLYDVDSPADRARQLKEMGIRYYLRVPMEAKHAINRRLGMDELLAANLLKSIMIDEQSGAALYEIQ